MIKKTFFILFPIFVLIFFKNIELFLLKSQFSWTLSKIAPYILLVLSGILISLNFIKLKSKPLSVSIKTILLILPFCIGFILFPIYEGDFSVDGISEIKNASPTDFKRDGLMVVAIADCPYCFGSIEKLKLIKDRNPNINIDFVVCTKNKIYIKNYIKIAENKINVRIADNADSLALTSGFRFPTFIKVIDKKPKYLWSNDQFGVRAIDEFEKNYNSK